MKKSWIGFSSLVLASSLLAGCGAANAGDMKVLSSNVKEQSLAQESMLQVVKKESHVIPVTAEYNGISSNAVFFNENGKTMKYDLTTKATEQLGDLEFYDLSSNGQRALARDGVDTYVLDFPSGEKYFVGSGGEDYEYYFADDEGKNVFYVEGNVSTRVVHLIGVDTATVQNWSLDQYDLNNFTINGAVLGVDGAYATIYDGQKDELYKLGFDGEIVKVNDLEGFDTIGHFHFLNESTIIFNDMYEGQSGIYTLNLQTNEVVQLVAGGEDDEGIWVPFYRLSPDKTKILFDMPVQVGKEYKSNVFVGNLTDKGVTDISNVMVSADLFAVIDSVARWSEDSTTVSIATNVDREIEIDTVEVFEITTK